MQSIVSALPREFRTESPVNLDYTLTTTARNKHCSTIAEENPPEFTLEYKDADMDNLRTSKSAAEALVDNVHHEVESLDDLDTSSLIRQKSTPSRVSKYEVHYEMLLKRSSQLWREIQKEQQENGAVDERKLAALDLVL